ncbi:DUF6089 family protein [Cesiribacter andamanensis]|uniref:DUF6089 domain-containing protein n=1 Tax=Cesiribacter andamanensis AMV16 TaxID=1279009 RepID=M7NZH9_9BACT|nr:DUF6089 family protein [Cesiribacter andamanensis]EMR03749.1 hypothetical protein ADICEAN_01087 [Cesiribacter andamanensis AMV16]
MKKLYAFLFLFALLVVCAEEVMAQRRGSIGHYRGNINAFNRKKRYISIGGSINSLNYFGDLAPKNRIASTDISFTRPGISFMAQYRMGPAFSMRGNFMWGRLRGDDDTSDFAPGTDESTYRFQRNLHFRNDIKELSVLFVFDLKAHGRTFITRPELVPYVFFGGAVFHHNPKARVPNTDYVHYVTSPSEIQVNDPRYAANPGEWISLKPLQTEGKSYSNFAFAIPVGAGVRYKLSRYLDLSFEMSYRQTFTDYLDDVSGDYINPEDFDQIHGDPRVANLARLMAYRSNEIREDGALWQEMVEFQGTRTHSWNNPLGANEYLHLNGYGTAGRDHIRGKDDKDVYLVSTLSLTYIIGTNIRNAKFR